MILSGRFEIVQSSVAVGAAPMSEASILDYYEVRSTKGTCVTVEVVSSHIWNTATRVAARGASPGPMNFQRPRGSRI